MIRVEPLTFDQLVRLNAPIRGILAKMSSKKLKTFKANWEKSIIKEKLEDNNG